MPSLNKMSDDELLDIAFGNMSNEDLKQIAGLSTPERSFKDKAFEVVGGVAAGFTNLKGGSRKVGQTIADTAATAAIPVTDKEAFKDTPLLETAGSMAGSVGGFAIGGVPGAVAGAAVGSGLGRAGDEGIRSLVGVSDIASGSDLAKSVGVSAGIGAVGEAIPAGLRPLVAKGLAPLKESVSPQADRALKFFANKTRSGGLLAFGKKNLLLRPAQATDVTEASGLARLLDFFDNISANSVVGSGVVARQRKQTADVIIESMDELLDAISGNADRLTANDLGTTIRANIRGTISAKKTATDNLYKQINNRVENLFEVRPAFVQSKSLPSSASKTLKIDPSTLLVKKGVPTRFDPVTGKVLESETFERAVSGTTGGSVKRAIKIDPRTLNQATEEIGIVDISSIKGFAEKLSKLKKELGNLTSEEQGFDIAADILTANDNLSFDAAKNARTGLRSLASNRALEGKNDAAVGLAKSLGRQMDEAIESALKKHDPVALKLWRKANRIIMSNTEQFDNRFIRQIIDLVDKRKAGNPTGVARAIFQPDNIEEIRRFKRAVDTDTFNKAKNWFTRSLFEDAATAVKAGGREIDVIDGAKLKQVIAKFGKGRFGKDILGTVYNNKEMVALRSISDALQLSQGSQGEGIGKMFIQLSQAGALVNATTGSGTILSPILIAPPILGRIFTNPITAKWLTTGIELSNKGLVGSPQFTSAMIKLAGAVANLERAEKGRKARANNPRLAQTFSRGR